jgi:AraC-like DNA-binding protein
MMDQGGTADPLGEALHSMRMSSSFYSRCVFTAPWGLELPAFQDYLMFHVVTSGRCWLEVEGAEPCLLQPGDLALVPHGEGHRLASESGAPAAKLFDLPHQHLSERYEIIRQGGGGALTTLLCGVIRFDQPAARHLVGVLPKLISVEAWSSPEQEWIQSTLRLLVAEARAIRPGGETIITRLADILVIQAIRAWIERDPAAQTGWLGALRDRQVGPAIATLHREPARPWTVATLAAEAAMSRSAFAARFSELVGETPMQYVARWRMHVAHTWLQEDRATLGELAFRLGYRSEAAFGRAFKRFVGVPPGAVRRAPAMVHGPHSSAAGRGVRE